MNSINMLTQLQGDIPPTGSCLPPLSSDAATQSGSNSSNNTSTSRRVTIGGMYQGDATDIGRNSITALDDMFGRRPSAGFDTNLDFLSHRRDSLDSSSAVLDAAILDLTRRRLSMAVGPNTVGGSNHDTASTATFTGNGVNSSSNNVKWANSGNISGIPSSQGTATPFAARQQQLQQQQRELEQRQKELELQRQQLMAGMQEAKNIMMQHQQHSQQAMMTTAGILSLPGNTQPAVPHQQWFVCQACNSKAFTSHDELLKHEVTCPDASMQNDMAFPAMSELCSSGRNSLNLGSEIGMDPSMPVGPFATMPNSMPLAMNSDKDWLTPLHCFVRRHCVEVFTATQNDVASPSKGKRKPIQVGQVGIRCPHCHSDDGGARTIARERGSVYYPTTISSIYNATMNLLQRHLHKCPAVPADIMTRYEALKGDDARSGTSKRYWVESALCLGLVDTPNGIHYSALRPPPPPSLSRQQHSTGACSAGRRNSNNFFSTMSNAVADLSAQDGSHPDGLGPIAKVVSAPPVVAVPEDDGGIPETEQSLTQSAPLVTHEDEPYSTAFSFHLISQMQPCVFTEADRLGKRKGLPPGFPGLACRHCFGGYGSGRFFPSSIKTLSDTSKTLNVLHNHMQRCRKCPQEVRETLEKLRTTHDQERAKMKFGSQKAFFARIWDRLHNNAGQPVGNQTRKNPSKRSFYSGGGMSSHSPQLATNAQPSQCAAPTMSSAATLSVADVEKMKSREKEEACQKPLIRKENSIGSSGASLISRRNVENESGVIPPANGLQFNPHEFLSGQHTVSDPRFGPPIPAPIGNATASSSFLGGLDALTNQMISPNPKRRRTTD